MAAGSDHLLAITLRLGAAAAASAPSLAEMGELLEQTRRSVGASAAYRELQCALDALPAHVLRGDGAHGVQRVGGAVASATRSSPPRPPRAASCTSARAQCSSACRWRARRQPRASWARAGAWPWQPSSSEAPSTALTGAEAEGAHGRRSSTCR
jgi:hypothetical protein